MPTKPRWEDRRHRFKIIEVKPRKPIAFSMEFDMPDRVVLRDVWKVWHCASFGERVVERGQQYVEYEVMEKALANAR